VRLLDHGFWAAAVDALAAAFTDAEVTLCGYDGAIGDGDHGTSMRLGFQEAQARLRTAAAPASSPSEILGTVGEAFIDTVGGVTGVVFGSLFLSAGESAAGAPGLDAAGLHRAFASGLSAVKQRGKVTEGDKSMVDALSPAVTALRAAADSGQPVHRALQAAARAAGEGRDATTSMEGKVGRARTQPARGRGHVDAGAASVALVFQTLAALAAEREELLR
jgi:dihydroxyacetone kinase-like protein